MVISGNRICRNLKLFLQFNMSFLQWPWFAIHLVFLHGEPLCVYSNQGIQSKIDLKIGPPHIFISVALIIACIGSK